MASHDRVQPTWQVCLLLLTIQGGLLAGRCSDRSIQGVTGGKVGTQDHMLWWSVFVQIAGLYFQFK
jgi:hypothetical protein